MKYVKQFSIILGISFLAELLEILIPFPIAASVYGLVIMLVGLITKLIPLEKVETAADFLVDAMSIMFVPATVGIMASVDALKEMLLPICVITLVSTILIMIVTGRVSQHIIRGQKNRDVAAVAMAGIKVTDDGKEGK
jgi:holin-like protein